MALPSIPVVALVGALTESAHTPLRKLTWSRSNCSGLTGLVGTAVIPTLLASSRISLRLLTTDPSAPALASLLAAKPNSAVVHRIDWASPESLATALKGVDVVVSTLKSRGEVAERWASLIEAGALEVYRRTERARAD